MINQLKLSLHNSASQTCAEGHPIFKSADFISVLKTQRFFQQPTFQEYLLNKSQKFQKLQKWKFTTLCSQIAVSLPPCWQDFFFNPYMCLHSVLNAVQHLSKVKSMWTVSTLDLSLDKLIHNAIKTFWRHILILCWCPTSFLKAENVSVFSAFHMKHYSSDHLN